ncbi:hypothetical protein AXG93_3102s1340 [Marchantia polymorpha subsp. ruderalis]|uniref:Peptidase M1 leukotriene A4 hydrolase/aminopeptidase C-terminal domain-containing protein n=1 Tax=Marchantia polymorpha subsp. ruderalis TaxID=1480154 RepID=A0A176W8A8_MARPO|nr:hypothetical protein AXG93_3102s1340 [Marchantia polymorpha subsp. ruderalis]
MRQSIGNREAQSTELKELGVPSHRTASSQGQCVLYGAYRMWQRWTCWGRDGQERERTRGARERAKTTEHRAKPGTPAKFMTAMPCCQRPVVGWALAISLGTRFRLPSTVISSLPTGIVIERLLSSCGMTERHSLRLRAYSWLVWFFGFLRQSQPAALSGQFVRRRLFPNLHGRRHLSGIVRCTTASPSQPALSEAVTMKEAPKEIFLKNYKAPAFLFDEVHLTFILGEQTTTVLSTIKVLPSSNAAKAPLTLDGEDLKLLHIKIDDRQLEIGEFEIVNRKLVLTSPPSTPFVLEISTEIQPQNNTSLEDRPDVMAKFTTRIEANKELYPVLLSNGNLIDQGGLEDGRHYAVWEDPFKKPSYLFALVAGQLVSRDDTFTTMSGREVVLRIYTPAGDISKTAHAMTSLQAAMKWDEDVYGLEYDLDLFNIVAVPDFNMGAMENKSLNIFNSKLVLASPETATDSDYASIEGVIGHEYFHNWTGNRVTCRDWFQLSLKEGLTVFRDQEFSSDMGSRAVKRIADVIRLRISQFPQDAGPMSHPVRPHSYIKGAEVVRMYQTLLGKQGFRKGMDLYFSRHDGQAVTCEDFLSAMFDANNVKIPTFPLWYSQAGTPTLTVTSSYDAENHTFTLKCRQIVPPTAGQPDKKPMLIPLAVGLLNSSGQDLPLSLVYDGESSIDLKVDGNPVKTAVLRIEKAEHEFTFKDVTEKPVPSLLRNFSAPVRLNTDVTDDDLLFLLAHDSDEFNRWEAGQTLGRKILLDLISRVQRGEELTLNEAYVEGLRSVLTDQSLDKDFITKAITLPGESELIDLMKVADPVAIHTARRFVVRQLAQSLRKELKQALTPNCAYFGVSAVYLASLDEPETTELAVQEYKAATNMTDQFAALAAIAQNSGSARTQALSDFYDQWKHETLVVNKWLALQAASDIPGNVRNVRDLLDHPAFDICNPNKVYSLIGGFFASVVNFHAKDGSGYELLGDVVIQLDKLNPQVASRMVSAFSRWRRFDEERQALAKEQLERITKLEGLSDNVFEIASKSLAS